jgi:hypothetical protein
MLSDMGVVDRVAEPIEHIKPAAKRLHPIQLDAADRQQARSIHLLGHDDRGGVSPPSAVDSRLLRQGQAAERNAE